MVFIIAETDGKTWFEFLHTYGILKIKVIRLLLGNMAGANPRALETKVGMASLVDAGEITNESTIVSMANALERGVKTVVGLRREMEKRGFGRTVDLRRAVGKWVAEATVARDED